MSTQTINVFGSATNGNQFAVQAQDFKIKFNNNAANGVWETPNPLEYVLAGFAGSVNAVGQIVAQELGIELQSLHVEISGTLVDKNKKTQKGRVGFQSIEILVKPISDAPLALFKQWIDIVKERCPVRDILLNTTPVLLTLIKEYSQEPK